MHVRSLIVLILTAVPFMPSSTAAPSGIVRGLGEEIAPEVPPLPEPEPIVEEAVQPVTLTLRSVNAPVQEIVVTLARDGRVDEVTAEALKDFFRCRRSGKRRAMHPSLLAILADVGARWPGHTVEVVSGYRAPPYGVPHSRHFQGRAIDLRVVDVPLDEVRDTLWAAHQGIGVGFYREQRFLHVDTRRPGEDSAWTSAHEGASYRYNPRWARVARQSLQ